MSQDSLFESVQDHFRAIDLCLKSDCRIQALILIYTGIDIFSGLGRPSDKESPSRQDYIHWCGKYLLGKEGIFCTATDLYAARCSVAHHYAMESKLSSEGKADELVYAYGDRKAEELQSVIDRAGLTTKVLHIETLASAFREGVADFLLEVDQDPARREVVLSRAGRFFKSQPGGFWR
ncbi:hypothetical protein ACJO5Y_07560 [Marinobacter sp. GN3S48]|uniref:hypothetical protein n=1 Tax=Marinobacter sp. GN3S48 TaxID=3382302 RepID=UPI00387B9356